MLMQRVGMVVVLLALCLTGCQTTQKPNWDLIGPFIGTVAENGARLAFQQPQIAQHKTEICAAVNNIAAVLENYNDPNATLDTLRAKVLAELNKLPDSQYKQYVVMLVDTVISLSVDTLKTYYGEMLKSDQAQAVLTVCKATADGLDSACEMQPLATKKVPSFLFPGK
jgi:hypothetical protein